MSADVTAILSRKILIIGAAVLLPVLGFGAIWATTHFDAQKGVEWDVPVTGYDPRDLLRGHYVTFQYEWPGQTQEAQNRWNGPDILCLTGKAPVVARATKLERYPGNSTPQCPTVIRVNRWSNDAYNGLKRDSIYIPQNDSVELTRKLADPKLQAMVRIRVGDSGYIRPVTLTFRPRAADKDAPPPE
jgi:uncharacterized membrane-anchored protein